MTAQEAKKPQFLILLLLVSFGSVGAVLFTPALPAIASFFHISEGKAQLTVTSFLLGYALGQLPYGPLANRFGRKKTLYLGITLSIVGSLLCALSRPLDSFTLLVCARFLQAIGACVGLKISFTTVADVYNQTDATKMISRFIIAFAVLPGLGVALGGWLTHLFNWDTCFYFLALYGAVILWASTKLPETAKSLDPNALNVSSILSGYAAVFKNKHLVLSSLMIGCSTSVVYVFASKAPFIGIDIIGMSAGVYGNYNIIPVLGMLAGSVISTKLAGHLPIYNVLLIGIVGALAGSVTMLIPFSMMIHTPLSLFLPMFFIYVASSLVFANGSSFGLAKVENKSNGSAVLNFLNLSATVVSVLLLEMIYPASALIMPISFVLFFLLMLWLWKRLKQIDACAP